MIQCRAVKNEREQLASLDLDGHDSCTKLGDEVMQQRRVGV